MRRTRRSRWPAQPAAIAALLVLTSAGAALGWRAGWPAVGAGVGLLAAVLLAFAVDRLTSVLVGSRRTSARGGSGGDVKRRRQAVTPSGDAER